jgi:hypothetical protein
VDRNFLLFSLSTILVIGVVIHSVPVFTRLACPVALFFRCGLASLEAILLICTPKKKALSALALVIRVFSLDSSSLRVCRKACIFALISCAFFFGPQTAMSQSSAYRTYSIRVHCGLGIMDLTFLLSCTSFLSSLFPPLTLVWPDPGGQAFPPLSMREEETLFFFRLIW